MNRVAAGAASAGLLVAAQWSAKRFSPTPDHPRTAAWYASLRKPSFTPPGPVFGLAWTGLDGGLAFCGYRLLAAPRSVRRNVALGLWSANVAGVAGFSWVLFGRKRLGEATGVTAGMVATSVGLATMAWGVDRSAGRAVLPLAAWTVFASVLQEEVWRKN
jgi:tryptophan-rich sensory protein